MPPLEEDNERSRIELRNKILEAIDRYNIAIIEIVLEDVKRELNQNSFFHKDPKEAPEQK